MEQKEKIALERRVFLFPGQGSQYPRMGLDLYGSSPIFRSFVDRAGEITGMDLPRIVCAAQAYELTDPEIAQTTIFTLSTATAYLLSSRGFEPWAVAGHSLGEYSALVAAGCLEWETALRVVSHRGRAMARARDAEPGSMAVVLGLASGTVEELCRRTEANGRLVLANYNAPNQAVVSGETALVDELLGEAREAGASDAVRLKVEGAAHSPLVAGAEEELDAVVAALPLRPPQRVFVSSASGEPVEDMEQYRDVLRSQITRPVLWRATMARLAEAGATRFVDVGPGHTMRGLARSNGHRRASTTAMEVLSDIGTSLLAG